jgi:heat shock protein HslJ
MRRGSYFGRPLATGAALALLLAACARGPEWAAAPAGEAEIVGPVWVAETIAGSGVGEARITLWLDADGRATGRGGCNSYGGAYTLGGNTLGFGPMAATKMACAAPLMDQEQRYFDALARVTRYAVADDGALVLTTADGQALIFQREAAATTNRATYACADGTTLTVTFDPAAETAAVSVDGGAPILLPQAISGSGFRYETPQHALHGKGVVALWSVGRRAPVRCEAG